MKRFILLAVSFFATAIYASAQYKEYYVLEQVGNEYPDLYSVKIDWDNKLFFIEGDGHNDGPIKNYKESGNKRTFDAYYASTSGIKEKAYSVVFVSDGEEKYTITMTMNGHTMTFKTTTKKPRGAGGGSDRVQEMKETIGKGITNGIEALKKKQEENKAKKEAKKQAKSE
jgi:hypothetical protein